MECTTYTVAKPSIRRGDPNELVPLQLPLHFRIKIIHLSLEILSLAAGAINLFVLAVELPAHDLGALVPTLGVAEKSVTVRLYC